MKEYLDKKDEYEKILEGLHENGTHPDFPLQKKYTEEEFSTGHHSNLVFNLPALVVYERDETVHLPNAGVVFALSNRIDGICVQVMSKHGDRFECHPIDESPYGSRPEYLLMKKHLTLKNVP